LAVDSYVGRCARAALQAITSKRDQGGEPRFTWVPRGAGFGWLPRLPGLLWESSSRPSLLLDRFHHWQWSFAPRPGPCPFRPAERWRTVSIARKLNQLRHCIGKYLRKKGGFGVIAR